MLGTRTALYEKSRESLTISLDRLDAHSMGALLALFERTVGFYASLVNINAYHQPGVEAGKKAATRVIELQGKILADFATNNAASKERSAEQIASSIGASEDVETVYKLLEHLAQNSRGIKRIGERHPKTTLYIAES